MTKSVCPVPMCVCVYLMKSGRRGGRGFLNSTRYTTSSQLCLPLSVLISWSGAYHCNNDGNCRLHGQHFCSETMTDTGVHTHTHTHFQVVRSLAMVSDGMPAWLLPQFPLFRSQGSSRFQINKEIGLKSTAERTPSGLEPLQREKISKWFFKLGLLMKHFVFDFNHRASTAF